MSAKTILTIFIILSLIYKSARTYIIDKQRKKPLPKEVSDIYDEEHYQKHLAYMSEYRALSLKKRYFDLLFDIVLIYSGFFRFVEDIVGNNVYFIALFTLLCLHIISMISDYIVEYIATFRIEEKYGLNNKTMKEFHRSFFLEQGFDIVLTTLFTALIIYLCELIGQSAFTSEMTTFKAIVVAISLVIVLTGFVLFASFMSLIVLKLQYKFTPLEDGELKDKINELQSSSKKKVKKINVYNESNKSTSKNAFLLKFLWIREFGIADNFINDNSTDELLAVLSHEIGHLKHKKNLLNYIKYAFIFLLFAGFVYMLSNIYTISAISSWINNSFDLSYNNYHLLMIFFTYVIKPILSVFTIYSNFVTRQEEYEADREAVNNGYGDALITMFKRLSKDELVNVNPSPIIEFLEYDHPGMYNRIKAIHEYQKKVS